MSAETDDLRDDEHYEWGVRHGQGTRVEISEAAAREWLAMSIQRKRRYGVPEPYLVRRRISEWTAVEAQS